MCPPRHIFTKLVRFTLEQQGWNARMLLKKRAACIRFYLSPTLISLSRFFNLNNEKNKYVGSNLNNMERRNLLKNNKKIKKRDANRYTNDLNSTSFHIARKR